MSTACLRRSAPATRARTFPFLAALALALPACQTQPQPAKLPELRIISADEVDPIALQGDVNAFAFSFRSRVAGTASEIASAAAGRAARESAIRWKMLVIPAIESARLAPDPRVSFAGVWAVCVRQRSLFAGPFGEQSFGDQVGTARALAVDLEKQFVELAGRYLPPERVAEVSAEMERRAADAPVIAGFNISSLRAKPGKSGPDPLGQVLSLPLMSLSAVNALGDTAAEVRNFANIAAAFGETARNMPEQMRWQMELLLLESGDHPVFKDTERIGLAAESIAQTAHSLQESIDRADGPMKTAHDTVQEAHATATQVDATAARAERVVASIDEHAAALSQTAAAWESTVRSVHDLLDTWLRAHPPSPGPPPGADPKPEAPPFDIRDAVAAADQTRAAVAEARGLLSDLQTSTLKDRLAEINTASAVSIDRAASRLDALVSRLVWSLAAVIAMAIIVSFAARLLVHRLTRATP